jgi:ABC-type uncharacterized transport system auxiliary subunit
MKLRILGPVVLASVAAIACVSSKPVHYYTLGRVVPPANQSKADGQVLLVGTFATPEALQDGRIRYKRGSNETGAYEFHRWTERPGTMVRDELIRVLRHSGKYQRVLVAGSATNGDYLVRGKLEEFEEVDAATIQTRISLYVEVLDRKTNQNVWEHTIAREEPVNGKTVPEVVQSLDRNLQHVVSEAADGIDQFLSTRH